MRGVKNEANGSAKANKVVSQRNLNTARHQPVLVVCTGTLQQPCYWSDCGIKMVLKAPTAQTQSRKVAQ